MGDKEMNVLFLRGPVPRDRDPAEAQYEFLSQSDDMWEHLAHHLGDKVEVFYWGGNYRRQYNDNMLVRWYDIKRYTPSFEPDLIFARGGFDETYPFLKRFKCKKIYYGSGARFNPKHDVFDIVLVDSVRQAKKVGPKARLWVKPAAPHFKPVAMAKQYDVCFVGDARFPFRIKIKRIDWLYQTCPEDISVLHLGFDGNIKKRKNIKNCRVSRGTMPEQYARCRVGIVPYSNYDSAPRVIPEMIACGLPVVVADSVHCWPARYGVEPVELANFWQKVRETLKSLDFFKPPVSFSDGSITVEAAAESIKRMVL